MPTDYSFNNETSQEERRETLANDRRVREQATFKDFADSGVGNEGRGGRFAKSDVRPTVKPLPPNSPWSPSQPGPGVEPPLGFSVNDLGFPSGATAPDPPSVETALDRGEQPCSAPTFSKQKE